MLPFLRLALHRQRAEIDPHQLARNVQAEAKTILLVGLVLGELLEAVEDQLDMLGRDAGAVVGHPDRHVRSSAL